MGSSGGEGPQQLARAIIALRAKGSWTEAQQLLLQEERLSSAPVGSRTVLVALLRWNGERIAPK